MSGLAGRGPNGLAGGGRQPAPALPERNGTPCLRPRPGPRRAASDSCHHARRGAGAGAGAEAAPRAREPPGRRLQRRGRRRTQGGGESGGDASGASE